MSECSPYANWISPCSPCDGRILPADGGSERTFASLNGSATGDMAPALASHLTRPKWEIMKRKRDPFTDWKSPCSVPTEVHVCHGPIKRIYWQFCPQSAQGLWSDRRDPTNSGAIHEKESVRKSRSNSQR